MNIYFAQMTTDMPEGSSHFWGYLPYSVGCIWAYAQTNSLIKEKYTAKELLAAKRKTPIHQYYSPQSSDILFRFPVQRLSTNIQAPLIIPNSAGMDNGRRYFGPVTIEKLKVKLLDDKGYPVDLHGADISLSLIVERLYQY